jgi:hypothetical protein
LNQLSWRNDRAIWFALVVLASPFKSKSPPYGRSFAAFITTKAIIASKLCTTMKAEDVTHALEP